MEKEFNIVKATPAVTAPTAVADLVYNGSAQAHVNAGDTDFGTLLYSLDGQNYSDDIPTATDAGTYTIYYKVEGSDNWDAVDAATVEATIANYAASLADNADNTNDINNIITNYDSKADVALSDRTLYKDGKWNTLYLPFGVKLSESVLAGAKARKLTAASVDGSTLNLTFSDEVAELEAGVPYIIKWEIGDNIVNPVFSNVTIDDTDRSFDNGVSGDGRVRFIGTYDAVTFNGDENVLLMGAENTLYYVNAGACIRANRAYFRIGDDDVYCARRITSFNIDFSDETTGISGNCRVDDVDSSWFTLQGVKLADKPTQNGVYIHNGKKIVIK